jgi:superfamily II DNA or RNA helicase
MVAMSSMREITLFPDQTEILDAARQSMATNQSTLLQACTGFGKSVIAAKIAKSVADKGRRATFSVPRIQLAMQLGNTLNSYGVEVGYIGGGLAKNPFAPIQVCVTDTLHSALDQVQVSDLLIADECHVGGDRLGEIIDKWRSKKKRIIGMSATPCRMDGKGMDTYFQDMVCGPQMRWLIDNGRLNKYRALITEVSRDAVYGAEVDASDYSKKIFGDAADHYLKYAKGMRALAFCRDRKHSKETAEYFNQAGIPAAYIDGNTKPADMIRIVQAFARREIWVLCNCQIATYGWDLSALSGMDATVEAIFMLRHTASLPYYMQIVGRMLRVGKHVSVMFDQASTIATHGYPCDHREWTLDGKKKKTVGERNQPVRQCGQCFFVHMPKPICPSCGHVYPIRETTAEHVEADLIEVSPDQIREIKKKERQLQGRTDTLEGLLEIARREGRNPRWAHHVWNSRQRKASAR